MWNSCVQMWERLQRTEWCENKRKTQSLHSHHFQLSLFGINFHRICGRSEEEAAIIEMRSSEIWKSASVPKWVKRNHRTLRIRNEQQHERRRQQLKWCRSSVLVIARTAECWRRLTSFRNFLRLLPLFWWTGDSRVSLSQPSDYPMWNGTRFSRVIFRSKKLFLPRDFPPSDEQCICTLDMQYLPLRLRGTPIENAHNEKRQ